MSEINWMNDKNINGETAQFNKKFQRSPFSRDIGSIIHSYHFRKLAYKTQVHLNPKVDYPRTRLTHSLEVAQVGVQLSKILSKKYKKRKS